MADIIHRVGIKAPISKVYQALATVEGVAGWWTEATSGSSVVGGQMEARFENLQGQEIGRMGMQVTALEPNKKVQWRFNAGPAEWIGTDAVFNLTQDGEYTIVLFAHKNWREVIEFTAHCSTKWAVFLISLKYFVENGKGRPSPGDLKIDNWN